MGALSTIPRWSRIFADPCTSRRNFDQVSVVLRSDRASSELKHFYREKYFEQRRLPKILGRDPASRAIYLISPGKVA
jgi:hypothetical protein